MKKIFVIRYGTIGDTIFASAFFRELRNALPNAQIDALVDKIIVDSNERLRFRLKNGLELTEQIERTKR